MDKIKRLTGPPQLPQLPAPQPQLQLPAPQTQLQIQGPSPAPHTKRTLHNCAFFC
jgi:hypothetical protein